MKLYLPRNPLQPGELPIKAWKLETAERLGTTLGVVEWRLSHKRLAYPPCRRVNSRVIIVLANAKLTDAAPAASSATGVTD